MSIEQYLLMVHKTREESLKDMEPEAEKHVKSELVLDQVAKQEEISVAPEEVEAIFRAYEQAGQSLGRAEAQINAVAVGLRREKTVTRLVELTTDADSGAEAEEAEAGIENAEAAAVAAVALAGEAETEEAQSEAEESAVPVVDEPSVDVVE